MGRISFMEDIQKVSIFKAFRFEHFQMWGMSFFKVGDISGDGIQFAFLIRLG